MRNPWETALQYLACLIVTPVMAWLVFGIWWVGVPVALTLIWGYERRAVAYETKVKLAEKQKAL